MIPENGAGQEADLRRDKLVPKRDALQELAQGQTVPKRDTLQEVDVSNSIRSALGGTDPFSSSRSTDPWGGECDWR